MRRLVIPFFFLSGAFSLIYELIYSRLCALLFGQTTVVLSCVIATYMLGMALGALHLGRRLDRYSSGLSAYGWFSVFSALGALLGMGFTQASRYLPLPLEPFWLRYAISAALIAIVILPSTFFMGGTLPALSRFLGRESVGSLYAWNTWGGVVGVLLSTFLLFPAQGFKTVLLISLALHLCLGLAAIVLDKSGSPKDAWTDPVSPAANHENRKDRIILWVALLVGTSGLAAEILWIRGLSLIIGSTTYAFGVALAGFLAGIALGGWLVPRLTSKATSLLWLGMAQIVIGALGPLLFYGLNKLPFFYLILHAYLRNYPWLLYVSSLVLCFGYLVLLTTLYGTCFPLACLAYADNPRQVGRLAHWNLIGSVLGVLIMPLAAIPTVGLSRSIYLPALLASAGGILLLSTCAGRPVKIAAAAFLAVAYALAALLPAPRDVAALSGVHTYADRFISASQGRVDFLVWNRLFEDWSVLFRKDGRHFTVGVLENKIGDVILTVDGKTDASSSPVDMPTQILLGQLGPLLHPANPETALIVGLGSGITLRSMLAHKSFKKVWCAEVEPSVVEASKFFENFGGGVPEDPRVQIVLEDARQTLLRLKEPLDLIVSEPSNPWMSGVSHLFTQEFYTLASSKIRPDGLVVQWLHFYLMSPEDFRLAVRTFTSVFPHSHLWWTAAGDVLLVGSKQPLTIPIDTFKARAQEPLVAQDLRRINLDDPLRLLAHCLLFEDNLTTFAGSGPFHTDAHPHLEFSLPNTLYRTDLTAQNRTVLFSAAHLPLPILRGGVDPLDLVEASLKESNWTAAGRLLDGYAAAHPKNARAWQLVAHLWLLNNQPDNALGPLKMAAALEPRNSRIFQTLSEVLFRLREIEQALNAALQASALNPKSPEHLNQVGLVYRAMRKSDKSQEAFTKAIRLEPKNVRALTNLAATYLDVGQLASAESLLKQATDTDVNYGPLHYYWGRFFQMRGDFSLAQYAFLKAVSLDPSLGQLIQATHQAAR